MVSKYRQMWVILLLSAAVAQASPPDLLLKIPSSSGFSPSGHFGKAVASAGDVNHDGYEDFVVGAPLANRAYIFFGGPAADGNPEVELVCDIPGDVRFGTSVAGAGDVNFDGFDDVIVGAPLYPNGGAAFIYFGGPVIGMDGNPDVRLQGEDPYGEFGNAVAGIGDINGDGYADVLVGAHWYSDPQNEFPQRGAAYVFYGGNPMDAAYDFRVVGSDTSEELGWAVVGVGDVDRNGSPDFAIGTNFGNRAIVFLTGDDLPQPIFPVELVGEPGSFGSALAGGDINGDGYSDVLVSAPSSSGLLGAVYVFYGGWPFDPNFDVKFKGDTFPAYMGRAVASGDLNGDGFDDVMAASRQGSGTMNFVNIFFGGPNLDSVITTYDLQLQGENVGDYFGYALGELDLNGDGYEDPLIGAFGYDTPGRGQDAGAVYIYNIGNPVEADEMGIRNPAGLWSLSPNPASGVFWLERRGGSREAVDLEVWSITGQRILQRTLVSERERLDLTAFPAGVYLVKVGTHTLRLVKTR